MAESIKDGVFRRNNTKPPADGPVMALFSLAGKTAIIAGAGQGIGLAVAKTFAEAGANVAIWYNSNSNAIEEAEQIEKVFNVKCKAYKVNVTSYDEVNVAMEKAINELNGRLDVFVANSGVSWGDEAFIDADIGRYLDIMNVNTNGVVYCAHVAGKHFRRQKQDGTTVHGTKLENFENGSFIATASMSGHIVNIPRRQAMYNASKAALIHMCRSLAIEWLGFARVNSVSPGFINTSIAGPIAEDVMGAIMDKVPMGRFGETVELKGVYLLLASDASSYMTGTDILVDGGYTAP
ncbi:NAD(P)-binding protein [Melanomma pulvis-pyrius CBS 109.77]|uniref:NADP-dependent mannitol dehydrogenase n=1 Tax=Melanomma pulvis-pyrius CBS 109.77 TaxID=1314802 RepID=A0A6A6XKL0_9PLEO|nr:NAD(P)-binding protein [Melanomma pulvis-pyrius CBS 109.77]